MSWKVILFETKRGERPVKEFMDALDDITDAKLTRLIDLLENEGYRVGMPHTKKLEGFLYELRAKGKEEVRIFYAFDKEKIYLLHGFKKKTNKTPQREIKTALGRYKVLTER